MAGEARGFTGGHFALDVDGVSAGWIQSAEGGQATADVVVEKLSVDHIAKKHLAGVKYEDISVNFGTGMSKAFYEWIKASFDLKHVRKNGAIIRCNYDYKEQGRMTWFNGLISEVGFPALDAASKEAAKMSLKISPEYTRTSIQEGAAVAASKYSIGKGEQKKWLPANFRLKIDGLDKACTRINKIEALVLKQKVVENPCGELRDYEKEPANLEVPNLVITCAESHADQLYKWHEDFVIKGNNGEGAEKGGSLEYLTPDLKTTLFTLTFHNLGIFKLTPEKAEAHSENIARVKAEMYCEKIEFNYGGGATWA
jgi:hypothetical protein